MLFQDQNAKTQGPSFQAILPSWLQRCPRRDLLLLLAAQHCPASSSQRVGAPPPPYRWPPKCGLKLVPSKSCFRSSQDAQMVANLVQKAPLRRRLKPTDTIVNWYRPQISKCKIHTLFTMFQAHKPCWKSAFFCCF